MATSVSDSAHSHHISSLSFGLCLAALGVVYGDIGTSPLYTMKEVFSPHSGLALGAENIIGAVSAIIWALILVVSLKYVLLILRADNKGEGGALALTALAVSPFANGTRSRKCLLLLGLFGATLFYGDSVITPAISVIGAMEGLEVLSPDLERWVVPASLIILIVLFGMQRFGTALVGRFFGPIILAWFVVLAWVGVVWIIEQPQILQAFNPLNAFAFLAQQGWGVLVVLGAIVLAITGAEALYADMGHFGKKPIQWVWTVVVFPSLVLNYLGQGALLMVDPTATDNPFFKLFPQSALIPVLILATLAAIIASQAVISGAYSVTRQAILLGFLPRMKTVFTSASQAGQIYMPAVNWFLLGGVLLMVLAFQSSFALASAYGIAVTLTMLITTILTFSVVRKAWKYPAWLAWGATGFFLIIDLVLFAGCAIKFLDGGWLPVLLGLSLFAMMTTWFRGRQLLMGSLRRDGLEIRPFVESLNLGEVSRSPRTAIYPVGDPELVPQALLHNLKHYQVVHDRNIILNVKFKEVPYVAWQHRVQIEPLGNNFWKLELNFGFMQEPDVPAALSKITHPELQLDAMLVSYFLSRETVVPRPEIKGMMDVREKLFAVMMRNASGIVEFFRLPDNSVVELGTRIQI